jgi:hypothetical protein
MKGRKNLRGPKKEDKLQTGPNKKFSLDILIQAVVEESMQYC